MKKMLALALCACVVSFTGLQAQNLLKNASFEKWESDKSHPDQWRGSVGKEAPVYQVSSDAQEGAQSIRITYKQEKPSDNCQLLLRNPLTLTAGEYDFEAFFKGKGEVRYINLILQVEGKSSKKPEDNIRAYADRKPVKIDEAAWKSRKATFTVPADGKYYFKMAFNNGSEETPFLMDNLTLKKK